MRRVCQLLLVMTLPWRRRECSAAYRRDALADGVLRCVSARDLLAFRKLCRWADRLVRDVAAPQRLVAFYAASPEWCGVEGSDTSAHVQRNMPSPGYDLSALESLEGDELKQKNDRRHPRPWLVAQGHAGGVGASTDPPIYGRSSWNNAGAVSIEADRVGALLKATGWSGQRLPTILTLMSGTAVVNPHATFVVGPTVSQPLLSALQSVLAPDPNRAKGQDARAEGSRKPEFATWVDALSMTVRCRAGDFTANVNSWTTQQWSAIPNRDVDGASAWTSDDDDIRTVAACMRYVREKVVIFALGSHPEARVCALKEPTVFVIRALPAEAGAAVSLTCGHALEPAMLASGRVPQAGAVIGIIAVTHHADPARLWLPANRRELKAAYSDAAPAALENQPTFFTRLVRRFTNSAATGTPSSEPLPSVPAPAGPQPTLAAPLDQLRFVWLSPAAGMHAQSWQLQFRASPRHT
jgi:hypothetical protein